MTENILTPWGGKRDGAGRKPKKVEQDLIEKLSPYDDVALLRLMEGVQSGDFNFLKLFFVYRYGMPKQMVDVTTNGEAMNRMYLVPSQIGQEILNDIPDSNIEDAKIVDNDLDNSIPKDSQT